MGNDTLTPAAETETDFKPVTFCSGASNYSVTREVSRSRQVGELNQIETSPGKRYEFVDGIFVAKTADDADWLRSYESFGSYYWEPESENAPRAADSSGLQAEIIAAALDGDRDAVADILVAERSRESRPAVLVACEAALTKMGDGELPAKPAAPLHEVDRLRVGPAAGVTPGESPDPVTTTIDPTTQQPVEAQVPQEAPAVPPDQTPAVGSGTMPNAVGPGSASSGQETAEAPPEVPAQSAEQSEGPVGQTGTDGAQGAPSPVGNQGAAGAPAPAQDPKK